MSLYIRNIIAGASKLILCLTAGTIIVSCSSTHQESHANKSAIYKNFTIEENDRALSLQNGVYYYYGELFSGDITLHYKNGVLNEKRNYLAGKLEGYSFTWFENGTLESKRYYVNGEKDGTHFGWYDDGSKRFEYNFDNGMNNGISTEWYKSGQIAKKTVFLNGNESVQAWRDNGKLYTNYVVRDGVIYGMNNSHLCYSLKNEKGEYVAKK